MWVGVGLLAVVAAVHTVAWMLATQRIAAGVAAFEAETEAAGWRLEHGPLQRGGWPAAASGRLEHVAATRELGGGSLRWTAERMEVTWSPIDAAMVRIGVGGEQSVAWGDGVRVAFHAASTVLRAPLSGDGPATLAVVGLVGAPGGGRGTGITVGKVDAVLQPLAVEATVAGLELTPALPSPFDGPISGSGRVVLTRAFDGSTGGGPGPGTAAARWRDAGGRVEAPALALDWGVLHATGSESWRG